MSILRKNIYIAFQGLAVVFSRKKGHVFKKIDSMLVTACNVLGFKYNNTNDDSLGQKMKVPMCSSRISVLGYLFPEGTPASPFSPFCPFSPCTPCGPGGPTGPCVPGDPISPGSPARPISPFGPVRPIGPGGPAGPGGPGRPRTVVIVPDEDDDAAESLESSRESSVSLPCLRRRCCIFPLR